MKYIAILSLVFSGSVFAETCLCLPEAGAAVSHGGGDPITSTTWQQSSQKYILSNVSGEWLVKEAGKDMPLSSKCVSKYHCQLGYKNFWGGVFQYHKDGFFSIVQTLGNKDGQSSMVVEKGLCTKL